MEFRIADIFTDKSRRWRDGEIAEKIVTDNGSRFDWSLDETIGRN